MLMKICTKCKLLKPLDDFLIDKRNRGGKRCWCTQCCNKAKKKYNKKYPWKVTYNSIKQRCNNIKNKYYKNYGGRDIKCLITTEELKFLWFRDEAYNMKKPSIDRKDNDGNYIFNNCRYMELSKNAKRQDQSNKEKTINQYDLRGNFIKSWKSMHEVERNLGFSNSNISQVCRGKRKTACGFMWRFR